MRDPSGAATPLEDAGYLTGKVVEVDPHQGSIDIKTVDEENSRIHIDEGARLQPRRVKLGDRVMISIGLEAIAVERQRREEKNKSTFLGRLTGEVANFNRSEGQIEIRTKEGGLDGIHVEMRAEEELNKFKSGDKIVVTLRMDAKSVNRER